MLVVEGRRAPERFKRAEHRIARRADRRTADIGRRLARTTETGRGDHAPLARIVGDGIAHVVALVLIQWQLAGIGTINGVRSRVTACG
jgi:hypothetical protein